MSSGKGLAGWHLIADGEAQASFALKFHPGWTVSSDDWREYGPDTLAVWKTASGCLSVTTYEWRECIVQLNVNWRPVVKAIKRLVQISEAYDKAKGTAEAERIKRSSRQRPVTVKLQLAFAPLSEKARWPGRADQFVEEYLFDVFLILNLALPGSCDFLQHEDSSDQRRCALEP